MSGRVDYFTSDGALQIQQSFAATTLYTDVRPFQTLLIPRTIESKFGQQRLLKVSIETLESLKADRGTAPKLAKIPSDLPLIGDYMVLSASMMSRHMVYKPQIEYPKMARAQRIQGRVILAAIVDENGNTRDLHVIQSPSVLLSNASLDALRQWRYQPTIVDGKAVAVDTTIRFDFTLHEWPLFTR